MIASRIPVYNAGGGWQAVGAGTQLKYRYNPRRQPIRGILRG
jgi:hypothetical protein